MKMFEKNEETPFELTKLVQASEQLLASGFKQEEVYLTFIKFSNINIDNGKEKWHVNLN